MKTCPDERTRLERATSYLLTTGVATSLALEIAGMTLYYLTYGNLDISADASVFIAGGNFFAFVVGLLGEGRKMDTPLLLMAMGAVALMLTPYLWLAMSAVFFAVEKNARYLVISLFVLTVLTVSLALH